MNKAVHYDQRQMTKIFSHMVRDIVLKSEKNKNVLCTLVEGVGLTVFAETLDDGTGACGMVTRRRASSSAALRTLSLHRIAP